MAIPLLSEIEKLINEKGSSAILGERIYLLKEQYADLEKRNSTTADELDKAKVMIKAQKAEIDTLRSRIDELEGSARRPTRLDELSELILEKLSRFGRRAATSHVAEHTDSSVQKAQYYLTNLESSGFIDGSYSAYGEEATWKITQGGLDYLFKQGKLT